MSRPLIGLVGRARSGKDTVAAHLVAHHGYARLAFADALKDMALEVDPIIPGILGGSPERPWRLSEVVAEIGWEEAKDWYPEVRRTLQRLGVAIRSVDPDFWVRPARTVIATADFPIVVTDVRFRNEADMIRRLGGTLARVTRPGVPLGDHVSETELDQLPCDFGILNNGPTTESVGSQVRALALFAEAGADIRTQVEELSR